MKKLILMVLLLVTVIACGKTSGPEMVLNLKGELPKSGEVSVKLYGYDKFLADHKATLVLIHREEVSEKIAIEIEEDAASYIDPPVKDPKGPSYYVRVEIVDGDTTYTQDFEKNGFIEVDEKSNIDVYMKKKEGVKQSL